MTDRATEKDTAWTNAPLPPIPPLESDQGADVCVVGAGIAGLTTAYMLARDGRSVVVVDDGPIGGGETGLTTAHITHALDRRWSVLEKLHSRERLELAAASHTAAIDAIEKIVGTEGIDCDFRRVTGFLFAGRGHGPQTIEDEVRSAHVAGLMSVRLAPRAPIPSFDTGVAAEFPSQAQFHVLRYLAGLARAVEARGGRIYKRTHVTGLKENGVVQVETERGAKVTARDVVLATNTPPVKIASVHLKQAAYRTYAIALNVPRGAIPPGLYWDTEDPFHYVRLANLDGRDGPFELLIVGGEDHRTGEGSDAAERHGRLEAWARERFPMAMERAHAWSGEVMETVDGIAYIGPIRRASHIAIATGDCGNGITHGTIAGMLIADEIAGRRNPWEDLYSPSRAPSSIRAAGEYLKDNLNTAAHYADWLTKGEVNDETEVAAGTGAIIRKGLGKLAVYREPTGELHVMSAACTHLGCIVHWNGAERTWDCPCHGTRYEATGEVIHGPATTRMKKV